MRLNRRGFMATLAALPLVAMAPWKHDEFIYVTISRELIQMLEPREVEFKDWLVEYEHPQAMRNGRP